MTVDELMVQKSGDHQWRLVVLPMIYKVFLHPRWGRISSINSISQYVHINHMSCVYMISFDLLCVMYDCRCDIHARRKLFVVSILDEILHGYSQHE